MDNKAKLSPKSAPLNLHFRLFLPYTVLAVSTQQRSAGWKRARSQRADCSASSIDARSFLNIIGFRRVNAPPVSSQLFKLYQ